MTHRETALAIIGGYLGKPYRWGGDDPIAGFDCSGMMVDALQSSGDLPYPGDWTANGIMDRLSPSRIVHHAQPGNLIFNRRDNGTASHIEMIYLRPDLSIGASGGGGGTGRIDPVWHSWLVSRLAREGCPEIHRELLADTIERSMMEQQAIDQNAYVRIRPWRNRLSRVRIVNPYADEETP